MGRNRRRGVKKHPLPPEKSLEHVKQCTEVEINLKNQQKTMNNPASSLGTTILDITSRLNLPLKPSGIDLSIDSDDEETLEFHIRPRPVFVSNLCLVCLNLSKIQCPHCKMVSYCSENHLQTNRQSHESLCRALQEVCKGMRGFSMAKGLPPDLYRSFRIKTIAVVEQEVGRRLDLWEREILLYPRICRTCNKVEDLTCCEACGVDFYCPSHQQEHSRWCKDLQVFRKILEMQQKYGHVEPDVPVVYYREPRVLPLDFDALIYHMCNNSPNYRRTDCFTYASLSYVATAPLTALYALQSSVPDWQTREEICVHVIGAEFQFECASLRVWEKLFLHFLPKLRHLTLEFTGPELVLLAPAELVGRVKMCRRCKAARRRIDVVFNERQLYHTTDDRVRPDLICLFNPGLYRETGFNGGDTWPKTIRKFCQAKVPVVITAYTEFEIPRDIERTKSICDVDVVLGPQKNPFAAVKPDRNFVSDDVAPLMYKNYCLCVVKGL